VGRGERRREFHSFDYNLSMFTPTRRPPAPVMLVALLLASSLLAAPLTAAPLSHDESKPKRIRFGRGQSSAVVEGKVEADADGDLIQDYLLNARAGQVMRLELTSAGPGAR
jgi:hypothetical protein